MTRASLALAVALLTTCCAAPLMQLPTGAGTPAPDAREALDQALTTCRSIRTISAEVAVSGKVANRGLRGRLLAGLAAPSSAYIEAPAPFGAPMFIFGAEGNDATLLLPRDRRVLQHGRPADVLEAIAGVPLAPDGLREALTGCSTDGEVEAAQQIGDRWRVVPGAEERYLFRDRPDDPWRLVAVKHRQTGSAEWRAEYDDFEGGMPRTIRLVSADLRRFNLKLSLSQVELNVPLEPGTFRIQVPPGTTPISLDELRDSGPLAEPSSSNE
jgi:hypothetical protein